MVITVENPTPEGVIEALRQQLPELDFHRMMEILTQAQETADEEENDWRAISHNAANSFFEDEA